MTADHKIINEDDSSRDNDRVAMIIQDRFTKWQEGYASKTKSHQECVKFFQRFFGPQMKPEHVYTDNSKELEKALDELGWVHDTSTPHRPQTNGVAERAVRIVKEWTSCTLMQSSFDDIWWPQAMNCFCFLRNVVDLLESEETAYKKRFGCDFTGPLIPFGAEINYKPITSKDEARLHQFGSKVLSGIFVGYDQQAGAVGAATS